MLRSALRSTALALLPLSAPLPVTAEDVAGDFDYYVMALSWSPNWCALEGDGRGSPECDGSRDLGWTLHGLWPQHETGWPQDCLSPFPDPSRRMTEGMADIMGASGLAWYQWNKHGACSGLPAGEYFDLAREAYDSVTYPAVLEQLDDPVRLPASLIEEAFLRDNPDLADELEKRIKETMGIGPRLDSEVDPDAPIDVVPID